MKKTLLLPTVLLCMVFLAATLKAQVNDSDMNSSGIISGKEFTAQADEMDLHGRNLSAFPTDLLEMISLKVLDLSDNNITELPFEIKKLQYLSVLKLNGNKISELPKEISRLKMLKEIYLDRHQWCFKVNELKKLTNAKIILVD